LPKKEFTSFDTAAIVHELKAVVVNSRVNNIYQLNEKTLLLKLHKTNTPPMRLTLEAGRRFHLTTYALENPRTPPAFCMALRKYLRNAWLLTVDQHEFERVATFTFETKMGKLQLILELFGEGNIILTSGRGEILQALAYKRMRDRNVIRGEVYRFPPLSGKNPLGTTRKELSELFEKSSGVEVVRVLARSLSLGSVYAEETLLQAGVDKGRLCKSLTETEINIIYDTLQILLSKISAFEIEPNIVLDEKGDFVDAIPFRLKSYEACKSQTYTSINQALDEFYLRASAEKAVETTLGTDKLQRESDRLKRVLAEQEHALRDAEEKSELNKQIGNMIYSHSNEIQELLDKFNKAKLEGKKWDSAISEVQTAQASSKIVNKVFESFDQRNLAINLCVEKLRFSVNLRKTLFENAAEFFELGKKAKQKGTGALQALEESRRRLTELDQTLREKEQEKLVKPAELLEDFVKRKVENKEWYEKFRWFTSSEGLLVVAGKDAVSNEVLVKKHTNKDDIVFHADVTGAPFVVIKTEGRPVGEQTLREASEFAAAFSRAWREGLGSADVYWIKPEQLGKTGPSGEYVSHGAFAVIGKRNWFRGVPLKVAIGIADDDGELRFVGGPVDPVKARAKLNTIVLPGDLMGKEILKRILHSLAVKLPKEQRERVAKASIERIREFVPYTKGRITEVS